MTTEKEPFYPSWLGLNPRRNAPWSKEEDQRLLTAYNAYESLDTICARHGRHKGGILSRLGSTLNLPVDNIQALINSRQALKDHQDKVVKDLIAEGYRKVSNKHRIIARIDKTGWRQEMALRYGQPTSNFGLTGETGEGGWADHYRRVFSKDTKVVPIEILKHIPSSNGDKTGWRPKLKPGIVGPLSVNCRCVPEEPSKPREAHRIHTMKFVEIVDANDNHTLLNNIQSFELTSVGDVHSLKVVLAPEVHTVTIDPVELIPMKVLVKRSETWFGFNGLTKEPAQWKNFYRKVQGKNILGDFELDGVTPFEPKGLVENGHN